MPKWVTPLIILALLCGLMYFRWNVTRVYNTRAYASVTYATDTWSGKKTVTLDAMGGVRDLTKNNDPSVYATSNIYTGIWGLLLAADLVWFYKLSRG